MKQASIESSAKSLQKLITAAVFIMVCAITIWAQQDSSVPRVEVKGIVGGVSFLDCCDETIGHSLVGAAVRIYVTKRIGIEPEYIYMRHDADDHDQAFNLNVSYDFKDSHTTKYIPYLVGGAGWTNNRVRFRSLDLATGAPSVVTRRNESWTGSFGGGIKIFLTKGLFVAPEIRLGYEPVFRASVGIGYAFPRKH